MQPNAAHIALARLEAELGNDLYLVTQNIDDLHERGGSTRVHHMHGRLRAAWCTACGERHEWTATLVDRPPCPSCAASGDCARTWCGSARCPTTWTRSTRPSGPATSSSRSARPGCVYPAAAFVHYAIGNGKRTLELNLAASDGSSDFHESRRGLASELVPAWVDEVLAT